MKTYFLILLLTFCFSMHAQNEGIVIKKDTLPKFLSNSIQSFICDAHHDRYTDCGYNCFRYSLNIYFKGINSLNSRQYANIYEINGNKYFRLMMEWNIPSYQSPYFTVPPLYYEVGYVRMENNRFYILNDTFPENAGKPDSLSEGSNQFETVLFDLNKDANHFRRRYIKYNKFFFDKEISVVDKNILGTERKNKEFHTLNAYYSILFTGKEDLEIDVFRPQIKVLSYSLKGGIYEVVTNLLNPWGESCRCVHW